MNEAYNYSFVSDTPDAPMPEGSIGSEFQFSITDDSSHTFYIMYNFAGTFNYRCFMNIPDP